MKLRNKKTGKIVETEEDYFYMTFSNNVHPNDGFTSIKNFNEIWEDYKPVEPLIKDEKIRKAVRAWAEMHNIKKVFYCEYSWKKDTAWLEDAENDESMVNGLSASIDIPTIGVKNRAYYTIVELCGENDND